MRSTRAMFVAVCIMALVAIANVLQRDALVCTTTIAKTDARSVPAATIPRDLTHSRSDVPLGRCLCAVPKEVLHQLATRVAYLTSGSFDSFDAALHVFRLWGARRPITGQGEDPSRDVGMLSLIVGMRDDRRAIAEPEPLVISEYGIAQPTLHAGGALLHRDSLLCALAEESVPLQQFPALLRLQRAATQTSMAWHRRVVCL